MMKKEYKYNYVYTFKNIHNKKIYIGVHSTNKENHLYCGVGPTRGKYCSSCESEEFRRDLEMGLLRSRIIREFDNRDEAYSYEQWLIYIMKGICRDKLYNKGCFYNGRVLHWGGRETIWTKDAVFKESRNYHTRSEFCRKCPRAYQVARENNWLEEMDWFEEVMKPRGYWTKEAAFRESRRYKSRGEFQKGCVSAYEVAWENNWLEEMDWFEEVKKPKNYWNKEAIFEAAKNYHTRTEFCKGCGSAYIVARKNNWLAEMDWFEEIKKPKNYWDKDAVFREAKNYQSRGEFRKGCNGAYQVARKNGWLDECLPKNK